MRYEINLDSNIIISVLINDVHCKDITKVFSEFEKEEYEIYLSLISYSEIWTGIELIRDAKTKTETIDILDKILHSTKIKLVSDNILIAKGAAKAQAKYKIKGGKKEVLIPDFLIGANAEFYSGRLLTTNPRDFFRFFSKLEVITPDIFLQDKAT